MRHTLAIVVLPLLLPVAVRAADEKTITLPADNAMAALAPGPGMEVARDSCGACHSTDYIVRQPRGDAKQWQAEVTKMIKVFGAPISPDQEKTIVEYLASAYGPGKPGAGGAKADPPPGSPPPGIVGSALQQFPICSDTR